MVDVICYFISKLPFVILRFRDNLKSVAFSRINFLEWIFWGRKIIESDDDVSSDVSLFLLFFHFLCLSVFLCCCSERVMMIIIVAVKHLGFFAAFGSTLSNFIWLNMFYFEIRCFSSVAVRQKVCWKLICNQEIARMHELEDWMQVKRVKAGRIRSQRFFWL